MKKSVLILGIIAVASISLVSCNKEQPIEEPVLHEYTFVIGNGDVATVSAGTRALLDSDENGLFLKWESTDELNTWALVSEGNYSYNNKSTIDVSTSPVTFKIKSYQALSAGATAYASYPYVANTNHTPIASLSIPTEQSQNGEAFVANAMPMVSKPFPISNAVEAKGTSDETTAVAFYNMGGLLEFNIYSPNGTYAAETIKSVTFEASSKIAGSFSFDLTTVDPSDLNTLSIADKNYTETTITTTISGDLAVGAATDVTNAKKVYMVAAPGSYTGTVTIITSGATYVYPISSAKTIERASVKRLGINLEKQGAREETVDYVTLPWESVPEGDTNGLSSSEFSNLVGVTASFDNKDYAAQNAPYLPKFSTSDHYIIVKTNSAIGQVVMNVKGFSAGSGSDFSTVDVSGSADGEAWTAIQSFEVSSTTELAFTTTNAFDATYRYVKIGYTKAVNNLGIGRVAISQPSTDPVIIPVDITDVPAIGVTDAQASNAYTVLNFSDDVEVASVTGCVDEAIADNGSVLYTVNPNYSDEAVSGTIVLQSAANHSVTATINVHQLKSTLKVSKTSITIPADATSNTFTVTTAEFGYNAVVATTESGMNLSISGGETGEAATTAQTVTVSSTTEAPSSGDPILLGTISVYRNNNTADPQLKTVSIYKAVNSGSGVVALYTAHFNADGEHRPSDSTNSFTTNEYTVAGVNWALTHADISTTGSPLEGVAHLIARNAKNTNYTATAITDNVLSSEKQITKVTFLSNTHSKVTFGVSYSTDGGNTWKNATPSKDTNVDATNGYSFTLSGVSTNDFRLKFSWSSNNTTTSNRDSKLDNIIVYGQ